MNKKRKQKDSKLKRIKKSVLIKAIKKMFNKK